MVTTQSEVFEAERVAPLDGRRHQILLGNPGEIVAGDWLRDLGTFRQVERSEMLPSRLGSGPLVVLCFVPRPGVPDLTLAITWAVKITVWRDLGKSERATLTGSSSGSR